MRAMDWTIEMRPRLMRMGELGIWKAAGPIMIPSSLPAS